MNDDLASLKIYNIGVGLSEPISVNKSSSSNVTKQKLRSKSAVQRNNSNQSNKETIRNANKANVVEVHFGDDITSDSPEYPHEKIAGNLEVSEGSSTSTAYKQHDAFAFSSYNRQSIDMIRVPYTSPEPDESYSQQEDESKLINSGGEGDPVENYLSLSIPGVKDSPEMDEEDSEIPTIRLLDGLKIDISSGGAVASIKINADLKSLLHDKSEDVYKYASYNDQLDEFDDSAENLTDRRNEMENELKSLFSKHESESESQRESLRNSWMMGEQLQDQLLQRPLDSPECTRSCDELSMSSGSTFSKEGVNPDNKDEENSDMTKFTKEELLASSSSLSEKTTPVYTESNKEAPSAPASAGGEKFLYKWKLSLGDNEESSVITLPVFDRRKDYDLIDEEIDRRVSELEKQLSEQMIQSKQAIEKLESQAQNTKFRIPELLVNQEPTKGQGPEASIIDPECYHQGFDAPRTHNINIIQQAKKLGLKNKDISTVFKTVTPRKKYRPTSSGKINLSKVTSRTNSGLKQRTVQSAPPAKNRTQPCLAQHLIPKLPPQPKTEEVHGKNTAASVAKKNPSQMPLPKPSVVEKVVKTLTLTEDLELQEEIEPAKLKLTAKPSRAKYQPPEEVRHHMEKCAKKPVTIKEEKKEPRVRSRPSSAVNQKPIVTIGKAQRGRPQSAVTLKVSGNSRLQSSATGDKIVKTSEQNSEPVRQRPKSAVQPKTNISDCKQNRQYEAHDVTYDNEPVETLIGGSIHCWSAATRTSQREHNSSSMGRMTDRNGRDVTESPDSIAKSGPTTLKPRSSYKPSIERTDPAEVKELDMVHRKMDCLGTHIEKTTLDRALLPPSSNISSAHQQLFSRGFLSSGLLSSPDKWFKDGKI